MGGVGDTLGGYKGYGWATVVELLSTAFQSGPFGPGVCGVDRATGKPAPMPLGHYFLAIDVESIVDLNTFKENAGNLLGFLRNSQKDPRGPGKIWTGKMLFSFILLSLIFIAFFHILSAGEPEWESRLKRTAAGGVVVPPVLLSDMQTLRDSLPGMKDKYSVLCFEK